MGPAFFWKKEFLFCNYLKESDSSLDYSSTFEFENGGVPSFTVKISLQRISVRFNVGILLDLRL